MSTVSTTAAKPGEWANVGQDLVRAASGGMLFGVPLIFTHEMWRAGTLARPATMACVLLGGLGVVTVLNRTSGFRSVRDASWSDAAVDGVVAMGLSLVLVTLVLLGLRIIDADTTSREMLGLVVYQAWPFAFGVAAARHYLRGSRDTDDDDYDESDDADDDASTTSGISAGVADLGATVVGAVFVTLNIAPTDEVAELASRVRGPSLLLVVIGSLAISYAVVFAAGFTSQSSRLRQVGPLQHPVTETVVCYLVSLAAAWLLLTVFGRTTGSTVVPLSAVIVLGLPTAVGGAAGRLAV